MVIYDMQMARLSGLMDIGEKVWITSPSWSIVATHSSHRTIYHIKRLMMEQELKTKILHDLKRVAEAVNRLIEDLDTVPDKINDDKRDIVHNLGACRRSCDNETVEA